MLFAFLHFPPFPTELPVPGDHDGDSVHTPIMLCAHFSLGLWLPHKVGAALQIYRWETGHREEGTLSPGVQPEKGAFVPSAGMPRVRAENTAVDCRWDKDGECGCARGTGFCEEVTLSHAWQGLG